MQSLSPEQYIRINVLLSQLAKEGANLHEFGGGLYLAPIPEPARIDFTGTDHEATQYVLTFTEVSNAGNSTVTGS